jgi:hypothetical protein
MACLKCRREGKPYVDLTGAHLMKDEAPVLDMRAVYAGTKEKASKARSH